jgi:hypothetical protein
MCEKTDLHSTACREGTDYLRDACREGKAHDASKNPTPGYGSGSSEQERRVERSRDA